MGSLVGRTTELTMDQFWYILQSDFYSFLGIFTGETAGAAFLRTVFFLVASVIVWYRVLRRHPEWVEHHRLRVFWGIFATGITLALQTYSPIEVFKEEQSIFGFAFLEIALGTTFTAVLLLPLNLFFDIVPIGDRVYVYGRRTRSDDD